MSLAYRIETQHLEYDDLIDGNRDLGIVHLKKCPFCCQVAVRGYNPMNYPWISGKEIFSPAELAFLKKNKDKFYEWETFNEYASILLEAVGGGYPVGSGTQFGIFRGKVVSKRPLPDFVIPDNGMLLTRKSVSDAMRSDRFDFKEVETDIRSKTPDLDGFTEIWLPPIGMLPGQQSTDECSRCFTIGSGFRSQFQKLSKEHSSVPAFRMRSFPGVMLVGEEFGNWIQKRGLTGLKLAEVTAVD